MEYPSEFYTVRRRFFGPHWAWGQILAVLASVFSVEKNITGMGPPILQFNQL